MNEGMPHLVGAAIDGWVNRVLNRGYASSWHYGELWASIRAAIQSAPSGDEVKTITEVCRNTLCPRGGVPVEIVVRAPAPSVSTGS